MQPTDLIIILAHLDSYLEQTITLLGNWTYIIIFLSVFAETGFVILPFLPGDSLLFVAGALAGSNYLELIPTYFVGYLAALAGDSTNYWIGRKLGKKLFSNDNARFFKKKYLDKTQFFYQRYGKKTVFFARFLPLMRTFAPCIAGVSAMPYRTYLIYSAFGSFVWTITYVTAGYMLGNIQMLQHLHLFALGIILLVLIPSIIEYIRYRPNRTQKTNTT